MVLATLLGFVAITAPLVGGTAPLTPTASRSPVPSGVPDTAAPIAARQSGSTAGTWAGTEFITMVEMPDGVSLRTKTFLPDGAPPEGLATILRRTPYRFPELNDFDEMKARFYADRGYAYVLQDCRGRFGSEGAFSPFAGEVADGRVTTQWIIEQPWCDGRLGTMGASYDGYTALAAAVDNPLVVMVVADDITGDVGSVIRRGGQIDLWNTVGWLYLLDHWAWPADATMAAVANVRDLGTLDQALLGRVDPFWQSFLAASDPIGPFFEARTLSIADICAPVLTIKSSGVPWNGPDEIWATLFNDGCLEHRDDHRLVITPDGHGHHTNLVFDASTEIAQYVLDFIDVWLGEHVIDLGTAPVRYRAPTDTAYRTASVWPAGVAIRTLFLGPTEDGFGPLHPSADDVDAGEDQFAVDPGIDDPCASDYPRLYFIADPLTAPLYLAGPPAVDLRMAITTPDADFSAILYDWSSETGLVEVSDGVLRARYRDGTGQPTLLTPGEPFEAGIGFWARAYEFQTGHQIVLAITADRCLTSNQYVYAENPNTGAPIGAQPTSQAVTYTFAHAPDDPMRLLLPVLGCQADLDGDGNVGFADLTALLAAWGPTCPKLDTLPCPADLDGNRAVGFSDLTMMLNAWGPCTLAL